MPKPKINVQEDCGNAPKMMTLRNFNIAFAHNDRDFLLENVTDDVRWTMVGDKVVEGKEKFAETIAQLAQNATEELTLATIMSHGKVGAVDGEIAFADGGRYGFCGIYEFSSNAKTAKIKTITTYVIGL